MASPHLVRDELDLGVILRDVATSDQSDVVVVLTTRTGQHRPDYDAEELARQVPEARVVVVPAHLSGRALAQKLGEDLSEFGGAARVYPVRRGSAGYVAPVFATQFRPAGEVFPQLVLAAKNAVARLTREVAATSASGDAVAGVATLPPADRAGVIQIDTPELARVFAQHLLEPGRTKPTLLVTRRAGSTTPEVDVDQILTEVAGLVDVVEMGTGAASWAFADALAHFPGTECYGGAARVYPTGLDWTTNLNRSPLRFTWNPSDAAASTEALIRDALAATHASGHETAPEASRKAEGKVQGIVSGRILVALAGGGNATIWPELTTPNVGADQLAVAGMKVSGLLDRNTGRLDVTGSLVPPGQALIDYRPGSQVLGRVVAVERELAVLELFPEVQVALPAEAIIAGRFIIDVRQWLSVGETVVARVVQPGDGTDDWEASLLDIDPSQVPLAAPPLLPGGPPWLDQPTEDVDEDDEAPAESQQPVSPAPLARPPEVAEVRPDDPEVTRLAGELRAMTVERDALSAQLARQKQVSTRLDDQLKTLRTRARSLEAQAARATKRQEAAESKLAALADARADRELDRVAFHFPEEQFRYEVHLEWARRIPAAEKARLPEGQYLLGPDFLTTLDALDERDRTKAVEVVVDIITGRVHDLPGRQTHQLRAGSGGDDAYVTRDDGATCWRVSLQHKTPQARRLHFWMLADGTYELSSVRRHDDMTP